MQRVNHVRERDQAFAGMADGGFGGGVWGGHGSIVLKINILVSLREISLLSY
jgi:hypothetical protein